MPMFERSPRTSPWPEAGSRERAASQIIEAAVAKKSVNAPNFLWMKAGGVLNLGELREAMDRAWVERLLRTWHIHEFSLGSRLASVSNRRDAGGDGANILVCVGNMDPLLHQADVT